MSHSTLTGKQPIALAIPLALLPTRHVAFQACVTRFGYPLCYLVAFLIYWMGWCILLPTFLLRGSRGLLDLFREGSLSFAKLGWKTQVLLWWPILFPAAFIFIPRLSRINGLIILLSILLGIVNGVSEEILWRGVYIRLFPGNIRLSSFYPSAMFGLWHVCPQSVLPSKRPGGVASFVLYALLLGLSYAHYARQAGSILCCTVSHCTHDSFGLGALTYAEWLI